MTRKQKDVLIYQRKYAHAGACAASEKEARLMEMLEEMTALRTHAYFCDFDEVRWNDIRSFMICSALLAERQSADIDLRLDEENDVITVEIVAKSMHFEGGETESLQGLCDMARCVSVARFDAVDSLKLCAEYDCFRQISR